MKTPEEIELQINEVLQKHLWEINSPVNRNKIAAEISTVLNEVVKDDTTPIEVDKGYVAFIDETGKRYSISFIF